MDERDEKPNRRTVSERIQAAEDRAKGAKRAALHAQAKVNSLKREVAKSERRKRAHLLISMGADLQSLGLRDSEEVQRLIAKLKSWTFTDKDTGNKIGILEDSLAKVAADRQK